MSLDHKCEVCKAKPGQPCVQTVQRKGDSTPPAPLVGRGEHYARVLPPNRSKSPEKRNEALA